MHYRDEGVTEVEKGVTEVEDVTKVDEETGEDMDELLHNVHILFSDKMVRQLYDNTECNLCFQ